MTQTVYVLLTADCETAKIDLEPYSIQMSSSGPVDYEESERSIRGYASIALDHGFPPTLLVHPEIAIRNRQLLLDLEAQGACLGLHLHPYKFTYGDYTLDFGAYPADTQAEILTSAVKIWEDTLGKSPRYFRAGYFSANDNSFQVLQDLGFRGGSLSNPGRILPTHHSVWAGAEDYPHRADLAFRQNKGDAMFVEVPVAVDYQQPMKVGHAGDQGFAWPYVPAPYDHRRTIANVLQRFAREAPPLAAIVLDTHNDQDYLDPDHPATRNLQLILSSIHSMGSEMGLDIQGATLESMCDAVLLARSEAES